MKDPGNNHAGALLKSFSRFPLGFKQSFKRWKRAEWERTSLSIFCRSRFKPYCFRIKIDLAPLKRQNFFLNLFPRDWLRGAAWSISKKIASSRTRFTPANE
jgi:hypothetical protein